MKMNMLYVEEILWGSELTTKERSWKEGMEENIDIYNDPRLHIDTTF